MKNYLTQNSKIKASSGIKTYNFGIPAYKSNTGMVTCPMADKCVKGCYATMGAYRFSNVAKAFEERLQLTLSDSFTQVMSNEIKSRKVLKVRIHDSGDFYSPEYLTKWIEVMKLNPNVQFYAYTKMVKIFKDFESKGFMPENFTYIFSYGGKQDKLINKDTERHSKVFETVEQLTQEGYIDASKDDNLALTVNSKVGLVYHGNKNYTNTDWKGV